MRPAQLLLFKRAAVCALIHCRVALMRSHADLIQCAVVRRAAVVLALRDRAFDAVIRVLLVHTEPSFPNGSSIWRVHSGKGYPAVLHGKIRFADAAS